VKYRLVIKDEAKFDLWRIEQYLRDNGFDENIADKILDKIEDTLLKYPTVGEIVDDNVRKIIVLRKNVVYYEVIDNKVFVLVIRAGGMSKEI